MEAAWWPVSLMYDRGIKRLERDQFPVDGILWYQGESNATRNIAPDVPLADDYMLETNLAIIDQLRGEKKIEFRPYSQHYCDRLFDRKVTEFMNNHCDDDDVALYCDDMRPVKKIHFHNYNNSWHLDCKCNLASDIAADDEGVDFLHKEYGCNELDALNAQVKSTKGMNYPMFFCFVLGEIIDTDLNV